MRTVEFIRNYVKHPAGSCLACFGDTKVICTATIEDDVPGWMKEKGSGWITAEYAMLPGSTGGGRKRRDGIKKDGRSTEIQRLIGRSLRAAVNMEKLGPVSIVIDCDVLQADGGTRTAAISGGWVALYDALTELARRESEGPTNELSGKSTTVGERAGGAEQYLLGQVAAVSAGYVDGRLICDLDYANDSRAEVDMNIVMRDHTLVEVQGTGEQGVFSRQQLNALLDSAQEGITEIFKAQRKALEI